MVRATLIVALAMLATVAAAQAGAPRAAQPSAKVQPASEVSGMYSFLREGEFVEVDVEPDGRVTGFISRYGERDSDRGAFLDHMFTKGSMEGNKLTFATRSVHGVSFEFTGTVERGEAKTPGAEAYYVIKGTLTQVTENGEHKKTAQQREVTFKSFPADALTPAKQKD